MGFIKRAIIAVIAAAFFAAFIISQGKWDAAIVQPIAAVFGNETAKNVDSFGKTSDQLTGKFLELGGRMIDGFFSDTGEVNPEAVGESLAQAPAPSNTRIPDYDRAAYGAPWADVDGNACGTRDDILARDLTKVKLKDGACTVLSGVLNDPYSGKTINFERGVKTSSAVQIDHVFSLSAAWKAGAHAWTAEQRLAFANDPENLLAVDGPTNGGKSDKTPADWMPKNTAYTCTFVAKYVYVAGKYNLAIDDKSRTVIETTLNDGC